MKKIYCLIFLLLLTAQTWPSPSVLLTINRHVTAWNFVNYRFNLTNTSSSPILNPEINYYAVSTPLAAWVDYSSALNPATTSIVQAEQYTIVRFSLHGLLFPGQSVEIHCRIYKTDWTGWVSSNDWSYQKNAEIYEPNYFMTVYDASHNILWGFDPLNGNLNVSDVVLWNGQEGNDVVSRYDGNTTETVPAGRFWMLKDTPVSPKERDLLAAQGIVKYSGGVYQSKTLALFRSETEVKKAVLDSLVAGFYNTVPVNDTAAIEIEYYQESLYEDTSKIDMEIYCWPDVSVNGCVEEVANCGGTDIGIARVLLIAKIRKDSLQCLSHNVNVHGLVVQHELPVTSSAIDRDAVNISVLQNDTAWQHALQMDSATKEWLSGVEYTGDGIVVGVYEDYTPDLQHPDFNEYDSIQEKSLRLMKEKEYYGVGYNSNINFDSIMNSDTTLKVHWHTTHVAGIIGGNGNASENFKYRGIAPKIHFYFGKGGTGVQNSQVGHVVNHSHITNRTGLYNGDSIIDLAIFRNWTSGCSKRGASTNLSPQLCVEGDTLIKTVVFGAANNGSPIPQYGIQRGYHSMLANSKNAITVGNMTSVEKVRFHHSSMGPTWDGRIKPDIMAPGATSQLTAQLNDTIEILIDYVKMYHQNNDAPYFVQDFENNQSNTVSRFTSCVPQVVELQEGKVLKCGEGFKSLKEMVIGWQLNPPETIFPTDTIEIRFKKGKGWNDLVHIYGNIHFGMEELQDKIPVVWSADTSFTISRIPFSGLGSSVGINQIRLDFSFIWGIIAPTECKNNSCGYDYLTDGGTSNAAPFVSGIAALMYQKFRDTTGDSLNRHSMRNSTVKALMIHTAVDMEDSPAAHFSSNPDLQAAHHDGQPHYTPYGKGPDFATGWGYVDGKAALDLISDYNGKTKEFAKFREIEIGHGVEKRWTTIVRSGQNRLRTTLVWDDYPGKQDDGWISVRDPKLVNDLDMYLVSPSGEYHYPWRLDPLPTDFIDTSGNFSYVATGFENIHESDVHDAYNGCSVGNLVGKECFDHLNNVEVVDVENP